MIACWWPGFIVRAFYVLKQQYILTKIIGITYFEIIFAFDMNLLT